VTRRGERLTRRGVVFAGGALAFALACGGEKQGAGQSGADGGTATTGAQATQGPPKAGGVYRIGITGALGVFDPQNSPNAGSAASIPIAYNHVLRASVLAADKGILWDLGTAYELADQTSWTFKLRPDVVVARNAKGIPERPLDAEDVKANYERGADPRNGSPGVRFYRGQIDKIEAPDKTTVRITTKQPYAFVIPNMGNHTFAAIAPREWLASPTLKTEGVGAGPFTLKVWQEGDGVQLEKNPTYYLKDRPYLDGYHVKQFADQATFRTAFAAGQIESYAATNIDEAKELQKGNKDLQLSEEPAFGFQTFWMNTRVPPWNDPRVRRAVALAINRQEYIQIIGHGQGEPIGPITAAMKPYALSFDEVTKLQPHDVAQARQLFQAAGVKEFPFVHSTAGIMSDYANIFIRQMQAAGVTAKAEPLDSGTWAQGLFQNKHTASQVTPPEFSDPDFSMRACATGGPIGSGNYDTGFSDPEVDALVFKAAATLDENERVKLYHEAQRVVLRKDPAWLNYFAGRSNTLAQPYVRGLQRGVGALATAYARDYWMDR
jgi:ABC-type transport system substrate-binding protein